MPDAGLAQASAFARVCIVILYLQTQEQPSVPINPTSNFTCYLGVSPSASAIRWMEPRHGYSISFSTLWLEAQCQLVRRLKFLSSVEVLFGMMGGFGDWH